MNPPVPRTDRFEINFVDALTRPVVVGKFGALEEIVVTFLRPLAQSSRVQESVVHLCRFPYSRCRPRTDPANYADILFFVRPICVRAKVPRLVVRMLVPRRLVITYRHDDVIRNHALAPSYEIVLELGRHDF
jgi:hypothetical protein